MNENPYDRAFKAAIAHFEALAGHGEFVSYLHAKNRGLKREAKASSEAFARSIEAAAVPDRRARLVEMLDARTRFDDPPGFLPFPVHQALMAIAEDWAQAEPDQGEPLVQLARLTRSPHYFDAALQCEPLHEGALAGAIGSRLHDLDAACHHLYEGRLIGTLDAARQAIDQIRTLIARQAPGERRPGQNEALARHIRLLDGFEAWQAQVSKIPFPDFMAARGGPVPEGTAYEFGR